MKFLMLLLGALVGYGYWYFWGCENGCPIKSVWYKMMAYGGFMGWVVGGFFPLSNQEPSSSEA